MNKCSLRIKLGWKLENGSYKSVAYRHARGIEFLDDKVRVVAEEGREDIYDSDMDHVIIKQEGK